jgi:hypothetical protein
MCWEHLRLPYRRFWWPPARPQWLGSQRFRVRLMVRDLRARGLLEETGPRVLLTNLWDSQALVAARLAEEGFAQLGVFMHDDEVTWGATGLPRRFLEWSRATVVAHAACTWAVSERLVRQLPPAAQARARVLPPIPAAGAARGAWRPEFAQGVTLGYAGKIYPGMGPLLQELARSLAAVDGRLTIITRPETADRPPVTAPQIEWRPFFAEPAEAARWLLARCSALLVAHPRNEHLPAGSWQMLRTSFPSKLVEYAQFGLPLLLIGERDSAFGDWAAGHPELPFFRNGSEDRLAEYLRGLRAPARWQKAAAATHRLAETEFNPREIQARFVTDFARLAAPPVGP